MILNSFHAFDERLFYFFWYYDFTKNYYNFTKKYYGFTKKILRFQLPIFEKSNTLSKRGKFRLKSVIEIVKITWEI